MPSELAADIVLRGGAVHTVDDTRPKAEAIAIRAGRITAVGDDREVAGLIGPRTRLIELRGRTVLPGFQDAHIHPPESGLDELRCDLREPPNGMAFGPEALVERIRAYAIAHPDDEWILGSGWYMGGFPGGTPHRRDLDAAVGDRPAFLPNRDGHSAWVSSKALELAGITAATPDPAGGRIERDPDGSPSGSLHEAAADLVERLIPPATQAQLEAGLLRAQAELHALGITAWQDAIVRPIHQAAYLAVAGRGQLTARVVGAPSGGSATGTSTTSAGSSSGGLRERSAGTAARRSRSCSTAFSKRSRERCSSRTCRPTAVRRIGAGSCSSSPTSCAG